jgi:hypothetical protein
MGNICCPDKDAAADNIAPLGTIVSGVTVELCREDITNTDTNAIVCTASYDLTHNADEIERGIEKAVGDELVSECQKWIKNNGEVPVAGVAHTTVD